jgi:hypothetical protein
MLQQVAPPEVPFHEPIIQWPAMAIAGWLGIKDEQQNE